jgi:putative peptide zinc metalloprotease protein
MLGLLKRDISGSFSDLWYRVGGTTPRLSTHARITQQRSGLDAVYIVEDPAGGDYYRLSASAYFFLGLLDGRGTVNDAWEACNAQLGDDAPTQRECIDLLSKLQYFGLLSGELPLAADMIELRHREAAAKRRRRRTGSGLSLVIPLVNPERLLERSKHLFSPLFSVWGFGAWAVLVVIALYHVFVHRASLFSQLNGVLDPSNLLGLSLLFILIRAWHEFGHAAACKAMGGRCTEMGLMLVAYILPFPYCDTSSAWRLPEVRKRVIVSAGGMYVETLLAAVAAIVWANAAPDAHTLRTMAYNIMFLSGVTTLVFNANPLLRYDGYYILSDLAGSANLAQRSAELTKFLVNRFVFKVASARPPMVRDRGEFWLLLTYNLLSFPYRIFISVGIVLFLWNDDRYFTLGAVLAVACGILWIVWPVLRALGFLAVAPSLLGRRARAIGITAGLAAAVGLALGTIPLPNASYAPAVLEARHREPIRSLDDGFIEAVLVGEGDFVEAGDPLVVLRHPEVIVELEKARADYGKAEAFGNAASRGTPGDRAVAVIRQEQAAKALARANERAESLTIRAAISGQVIPSPGATRRLRDLPGYFVSRGALLGLVATTDDLVVRSVVSDNDHGYIFDGRGGSPKATLRVRGDAGRVIEADVSRIVPVGSRDVTTPSLAADVGGEIVLDPRDPERRTSLTPQFIVELEPLTRPSTWQPGLRGRVRFDSEPRPLLAQWWRRLRQYVDDQMKA